MIQTIVSVGFSAVIGAAVLFGIAQWREKAALKRGNTNAAVRRNGAQEAAQVIVTTAMLCLAAYSVVLLILYWVLYCPSLESGRRKDTTKEGATQWPPPELPTIAFRRRRSGSNEICRPLSRDRQPIDVSQAGQPRGLHVQQPQSRRPVAEATH